MIFEGISPHLALSAFTAAAVVATGLFFLRSHYRPRTVVTTLFWREALRQPLRRRLGGRFSHWPYWLLALLALGLLLLGLTEPVLTGSAHPDALVVILDAGSDGAALDSDGRSLYRRAVDLLPPLAARGNNRLAVIAAVPGPVLIKAFEEHFYPVRLPDRAVATAPAALDRAVRLAETLLENAGGGRILVLTRRDWVISPSRREVRVVTPAAPASQIRLIAAVAEADTVRLTLEQHGHTRQPLRVALRDGSGRTLEEIELRPERDGVNHFRLPFRAGARSLAWNAGDRSSESTVAVVQPELVPVRVAGAEAAPAVLQLLWQTSPLFLPVSAGATADLTVGTAAGPVVVPGELRLVETPPAATGKTWRYRDRIVGGRDAAGHGWLVRRELTADAPSARDPEFIAELATFMLELSGRSLPGRGLTATAVEEAIGPLAVPLSTAELRTYLPPHFRLAAGNWLLAAAALLFLLDAVFYAQNRSP